MTGNSMYVVMKFQELLFAIAPHKAKFWLSSLTIAPILQDWHTNHLRHHTGDALSPAAGSWTVRIPRGTGRGEARRLELARSERVPPYVVASDRTLHEIAEVRPKTLADLEGIYGIGAAKVARYGASFIDVVRGS